MADLDDGARAIRRLRDELERNEGLPEAYAEAILQEATQRAQSKPTPQSRMAAAALVRQGSELIVLADGPPGEVSGGSEWGSNIYRQFGPRNDGGYWLFPSADSPVVEAAGDRYLDLMVERVVRTTI